VLFPSRYEGFGFPLVEAFAANAPVLAADIPAFREIAQAGAHFAPPDDPRAWADAVTWLGRNPDARAALIAAGRARAAGLTYERTAAATVTALRDALLDVASPASVAQPSAPSPAPAAAAAPSVISSYLAGVDRRSVPRASRRRAARARA
jgi:hypothetical protein